MVYTICLYVIITQVSTDLYIQSSHNVSQSCISCKHPTHIYIYIDIHTYVTDYNIIPRKTPG